MLLQLGLKSGFLISCKLRRERQLDYPTSRAVGLMRILEKFKVGYCPEGWDVFTKAAIEAGYDPDRLAQTGLYGEKTMEVIYMISSTVASCSLYAM